MPFEYFSAYKAPFARSCLAITSREYLSIKALKCNSHRHSEMLVTALYTALHLLQQNDQYSKVISLWHHHTMRPAAQDLATFQACTSLEKLSNE